LETVVRRSNAAEGAFVQTNMQVSELTGSSSLQLRQKIDILQGRLSKLYQEKKDALCAGFTVDLFTVDLYCRPLLSTFTVDQRGLF
jgi:hypothetical protein